MKKYIRLLVENLFNDIYNIEDQKNLDTEFSDKVLVRTKEELRKDIEKQLQIQGPNANLNDLNLYGITDMSHLFEGLNIKNIKIDKWDVSQVKDMSCMFKNCGYLNLGKPVKEV